MPSSTFFHLNETKQLNIKEALLSEFSHHSLANAQVARIIKTAGIARGTFYKYFPNLLDAYQWLLGVIMGELQLHPQKLVQGNGTSQEYREAVHQLILRINNSEYIDFLKMYYVTNEGILDSGHTNRHMIAQLNSQQWAIMVLCHQAIKESLITPLRQVGIEKRLGEALDKIIGG